MRLRADQRFFVIFQTIFWSLWGLLFFLAINPYHPFLDTFLLQTTATLALGILASVALAGAHALVVRWRLAIPSIIISMLVSCVVLGIAWYALAAWASNLIDPFEISVVGVQLFAWTQMPAFPLVLLLWSLLFLAGTHVREQQLEKQRRLRSEALAHEARLRMLRYQLNPHFLFNALNSVGSLVEEAPDRIPAVIGELSRFLRYSLLDADHLEVELREELRATEYYLEIEKLRFEDDLDAAIELEPAAADRIVPAFIVLPLIENSIKYGRCTSPTPLRIRVVGRIDSGALCIDVQNTGTWASPSGSPEPSASTGTGIQNVRERLLAHYPDHHQFEVHEDAGWVIVSIRIDDDD